MEREPVNNICTQGSAGLVLLCDLKGQDLHIIILESL